MPELSGSNVDQNFSANPGVIGISDGNVDERWTELEAELEAEPAEDCCRNSISLFLAPKLDINDVENDDMFDCWEDDVKDKELNTASSSEPGWEPTLNDAEDDDVIDCSEDDINDDSLCIASSSIPGVGEEMGADTSSLPVFFLLDSGGLDK